MVKSRVDQADGLRRLLDRDGLRVVSVSPGRRGDAGIVVNLAGALAELGNEVLVLDERPGPHGVASALGLKMCFDLCDVVGKGMSLEDMIVRGPAGIRVLPLARAAPTLSKLSGHQRKHLFEHFGRLDTPVDTLLVDASPGRASALTPPGACTHEVIVLAGGCAEEITASYTLIKRLNQEFSRRNFHVLVCNIASESKARMIVNNMAEVARRYLQVTLHFMGHVPTDEKLHSAARLRLPIVTAFPSAVASASFRGLAQTMIGWRHAENEDCGFDDVMGRLRYSNDLHAAVA